MTAQDSGTTTNPNACPDCGHDGYDAHDVRATGRRMVCVDCDDDDPCSAETLSTVTGADIVAAIHAADASILAGTYQSGGGCATVYASRPGAPAVFDYDYGRAWLAIGPGSYDYGTSSRSRFSLDDLYIGTDDLYGLDPIDGPDGRIVDTLDDITAWISAAISAEKAGTTR